MGTEPACRGGGMKMDGSTDDDQSPTTSVRISLCRKNQEDYTALELLNLFDISRHVLQRLSGERALELWDVHRGPGQSGVSVYTGRLDHRVVTELRKTCKGVETYAAWFEQGLLTRYQDLASLARLAPRHITNGGSAVFETLTHERSQIVRSSGTHYTYIDFMPSCTPSSLDERTAKGWTESAMAILHLLHPWDHALVEQITLGAGSRVIASISNEPRRPSE